MTTIAFDGHILAVDRASTSGSVIFPCVLSKVAVYNDEFLIAGFGCAAAWRMLVKWWVAEGAGNSGWYPPPPHWDQGHYGLVVLSRKGEFYSVDKDGCRLDEPTPHSEGSGCYVAIGALHAGANAVEAVRIACKLDVNTRGPIDYVIVGSHPWIIRQAPDPATRDTVAVRHDGDVPEGVRPNGSANGGSAPRPQHEGHP